MEIITYDKADEVIEELFESLLSRYQIGLETSMQHSNFLFSCVHLLYYVWHKINLDHGGSDIDTTHWIKMKKRKNKSCQCW